MFPLDHSSCVPIRGSVLLKMYPEHQQRLVYRDIDFVCGTIVELCGQDDSLTTKILHDFAACSLLTEQSTVVYVDCASRFSVERLSSLLPLCSRECAIDRCSIVSVSCANDFIEFMGSFNHRLWRNSNDTRGYRILIIDSINMILSSLFNKENQKDYLAKVNDIGRQLKLLTHEHSLITIIANHGRKIDNRYSLGFSSAYRDTFQMGLGRCWENVSHRRYLVLTKGSDDTSAEGHCDFTLTKL